MKYMGGPRVTTDILDEILHLRDRKGLTFREISKVMGLDLKRVHQWYTLARKKRQELVDSLRPVAPPTVPPYISKSIESLAPGITPPLISAIEEPETFRIGIHNDAERAVILDPSTPTVPRGVLLEDDKLADKLNHLIQRLLAITEGEADLLVQEMTGPQRIEAASKLVDKMRALRNQSTEVVNTNTFVDLISKITASMRKGLVAIDPHTLRGSAFIGPSPIDDVKKPKRRKKKKVLEVVPACPKS